MKWLVESALLDISEPGLEPRSLCLLEAALALIHKATFLFAAHSAASPRLRKMCSHISLPLSSVLSKPSGISVKASPSM